MALAVVIGAIGGSAFAAAQEEQESTDPSLRDLFVDPEDCRFDVSALLATEQGFLSLGSIITESAVGYGGALGLAFFHDSTQNRVQRMSEPTADGRPPRLAPPSVSGVYRLATEKEAWAAGAFHFGVWKNDSIRHLGAAGYASVNMDYYGVGEDKVLPVGSISYNLDGEGACSRCSSAPAKAICSRVRDTTPSTR